MVGPNNLVKSYSQLSFTYYTESTHDCEIDYNGSITWIAVDFDSSFFGLRISDIEGPSGKNM